jgi:diguanylate cyclase
MSRPPLHNPLSRLLLGSDRLMQRHVWFALLSFVPYVGSVISIVHAWHLGYISETQVMVLLGLSLSTCAVVYALVRSGWSARFQDPVLALPHSVCGVLICLGAYASLGPIRANVIILIAQIIVLSMFRLRPRQVLGLGVATVAMLGACIVFVTTRDPVKYPATSGWAHFVLAGSALLSLSLIGKWVSDIRSRIARQAGELTDAIATLQQMATTDMLTGTLNRRMLTELMENEFKLWERTSGPFCLVLIDIDHFKQVNDRHGHGVGDMVLRRFVADALPQLRQVDKLGRWGGEEFLLMLPRVSMEAAMVAAERLRSSFEALRFDEAPGLRVTLSAGVAQVCPGEALEHTVDRADAALYRAKQTGRNRCQAAGEPGAAASTGAPTPSPIQPDHPVGVSA